MGGREGGRERGQERGREDGREESTIWQKSRGGRKEGREEEGRFGEGESNNIVGIDGGGEEEVRRCKEGGTEREK